MLKTPPLQTATATIDTLCGRLQSATLLEDRRAAILGLRSFAKQYPASVASGSLRELIAILRRDGLGEARGRRSEDGNSRRSQEGGDVDTVRLVLETLLMLFNPDTNSPEAGDEIAFYMADEFSMRQDNIALLLALLDPTSPLADYYSRLYAVQIMSAVCAARPDRLQECILSAPLGVSRLVGVLDDGRDAVRNAGLLLLVDLTSGANEDLRKIVAFEDVFGKVFALIQTEGGLADAGITAQDCLSLLANLIKGSSSNQTMFRESGCVAQLSRLLQEAHPPDVPEAAFLAQSREKAAWGLLQLLRLFLVPGEASTAQNQLAFFRAGTAQVLIDLGFSASLPPPIRTSALRCAAALIQANAPLQEQFAALTVTTPANAAQNTKQAQTLQVNGSRSKTLSAKNSARPSVEHQRTYIIEALLELSLNQPQAEPSMRAAACGLSQAYLTQHDRIKAHFLQRATAGHAEHEAAANVLITLLHPSDTDASSVIYASWIVQDLIAGSPDAKAAVTQIKEGNESEGEDVLTSLQALASQLHASLQYQPVDARLVAAYASLLTTLLWDFAPGIDDLLSEGSSLVQTLLTTVRTPTDPLVAGVAAALLGTIYEFSTKDSPISRRTLAPLLLQKLGRAKYLSALLDLRRDPAIRDFDLAAEDEAGDGLLSAVYVDLFTVEYARLRKAIDKDPGVEVLPPSAAEAGIDRDVLDDLRQQLQTAKDALTQAQQGALEAGQKGEQDLLASAKELQTSTAEIERLRKINQAMQQGHESDLAKLNRTHEQQRGVAEQSQQRALADARQEIERQGQAALREREAAAAQKAQEYERRLAELGNAHRSEASGHVAAKQQLEALTSKHNEVVAKERDLGQQVEEHLRMRGELEREVVDLRTRATKAEGDLETAQGALSERGEAVERLTAQITELRDELSGREEELKTERTGFAELEKELEAAKTAATPAPVADGVETEKLEKLDSQLKSAKAGEKSAKEELESMLLVMGDIEAKRDEYKAKIKELGGEVSDDDEEEEDEEEDADEEDEEDGDEGVKGKDAEEDVD